MTNSIRPVFLPFKAVCQWETPSFERLLQEPQIKDLRLTDDFNVMKESDHLKRLWERSSQLRRYRLIKFISAGSTGMVFQACIDNSVLRQAIKIVRCRTGADLGAAPNQPASLSSLSPLDLRILKSMVHPNAVRLLDAVECDGSIVAVSTSYVEAATALDRHLWADLSSIELVEANQGMSLAAWRQLEDICTSLTDRFIEIATALVSLHSQGVCHFDIKPSNMLISQATGQAVLTDLDSCAYIPQRRATPDFPVCFTSTYAHPDLAAAAGNQNDRRGNRLKVTAKVRSGSKMDKYDLFAFGRSIQESLAILEWHYGEQCFCSSAFNYLHLIGCLLLDGYNAPRKKTTRILCRDGRRFMDDIACDYDIEAFQRNKITSAHDLLERLTRANQPDRCRYKTPQIDVWPDGVSKKTMPLPIPYAKKSNELDFHGTGYV